MEFIRYFNKIPIDGCSMCGIRINNGDNCMLYKDEEMGRTVHKYFCFECIKEMYEGMLEFQNSYK